MEFDDIETPFMDADVRQKITADPNLANDKKLATLTACTAAANESDTATLFDDCAEANRLVGQMMIALEADEFAGHIKLLDAVSWFLSRTLNDHPENEEEYTPNVVDERVRSLSLPGMPLRKKEALLWFEEEVFEKLPEYTVAGRPTWLFQADDGDARLLLQTEEIKTLPCRLGLPEPRLWGDPPHSYPTGLEFVGFAFSGEAVDGARRPTALDGSYKTVKMIWVIGGRTEPLPHGPTEIKEMGGLMELVAEPPLLSKTIDNVYVFEN